MPETLQLPLRAEDTERASIRVLTDTGWKREGCVQTRSWSGSVLRRGVDVGYLQSEVQLGDVRIRWFSHLHRHGKNSEASVSAVSDDFRGISETRRKVETTQNGAENSLSLHSGCAVLWEMLCRSARG